MTTGLIYTGKGASLPNVPARDLSHDEIKHLERTFQLTRQALIDSGLYQSVSTETPKKKSPLPDDEVKHDIRE